MLLASLSTGHKVGLAVMAAIFILYALASSFLLPRRWPDYPGRGLSAFVVASLALFVLMLGAVELFGVESSKAEAKPGEGAQSRNAIRVVETEYRIQLPAKTALRQGSYRLHVVNQGKQAHNLVVQGPSETQSTKTIPPGGSADIVAVLRTGNYSLYCSIDGHRKLGMVAQLAVR